MSKENEYPQRERQRLAWIVVLGSFSLCLIMTIAIPLTVNVALQNMKRPLTTIIQANQGTVRVDNDLNESSVLIAGEADIRQQQLAPDHIDQLDTLLGGLLQHLDIRKESCAVEAPDVCIHTGLTKGIPLLDPDVRENELVTGSRWAYMAHLELHDRRDWGNGLAPCLGAPVDPEYQKDAQFGQIGFHSL